nr:unnamed protein product [Spirometra erinaceieuropaei]
MNHFHASTNCLKLGFDLASSSTTPGGQRHRIEDVNTDLIGRTTKSTPKPPQPSFLDDLGYPCDIVAASADYLIRDEIGVPHSKNALQTPVDKHLQFSPIFRVHSPAPTTVEVD